jgi:type IV secretory pathway VirB4 component
MNLADRRYLLENAECIASQIPYAVHATHELVSTHAGDYVAVLRLDGVAFQTADIGDVNIAHESLNIVLRNIASAHLTIWTHTVHDEEKTYVDGTFPTAFARAFDALYKRDMGGTRLMSSALYVSLVYRPIVENTERAVLQRKRNASSSALRDIRAEAREKLGDAVRMFKRMMGRYNPVQLHTYRHNGILYSAPLEFFGYLVNGYWQRIPVLAADIATYLATARPLWGVDAYELRGPVATRYGVMLAFQTYPGNTYPGLLNEFLTQPFSYVLTQSYQFMDRTAAREALGRERAKLDGSGELVDEQVADIEDKIRALNNGEIVYGGHHLSLNIFAGDERSLKSAISLGASTLGNTGCNIAREDDALVEAFLAQLPSNFRQRPRLSGLDSRNFASLASFHNYPTGQKTGNQWGDAITMLRTTAGSPYFFNYHHSTAAVQKLIRNSAELDYSIPSADDAAASGGRRPARDIYAKLAEREVTSLAVTDVDEEYLDAPSGALAARPSGERQQPRPQPPEPTRPATKRMIADLGNVAIIGPAGSGKTVMQGVLSTFSLKIPQMRCAVLDKDEGMRLMVLANGGTYLSIKHGVPSGMAPLQIDAGEANTSMLIRLVKKLCTPVREVLTVNEANGISYAVRQVMKRPIGERRLRKVFDLMTSDSSEGAKARLEKWVYGGDHAWVFDAKLDQIALDARLVGFDVTDFLGDPEIRSPIVMYLAHRIRHEMITGTPFVWFWDEFWKSLDDPELTYIAKDELKTIRKKNGLLVMGTQEAEDVVKSTIGSTIIQQTATMILCPNPKGDRKAYMDGLKLTETEYQIVRTGMPPGSNRYLIKQGHSSVVVELDLSATAFADALSILSGTKENVHLYEAIAAELGTADPDRWLPVFYERRSAT